MPSFALHSAPRDASFRIGSARLIAGLAFGLSLTLGIAGGAKAQPPPPIPCTGGDVPEQALLQPAPAEQPDLRIEGNCAVVSGKHYFYANVNILNGGTLSFPETPNSPTNFHASSIIVENGGAMTAGARPHPLARTAGR